MTLPAPSSNSVHALGDDIRRKIRDVPDFPNPGIVFKDITPLLADPILFHRVTAAMAEPFLHSAITHVMAIESRGFLLGAPVALALKAALIPMRKPGKLPSRTSSISYALEYGTDTLEIHADACDNRANVLIVDDVLATGGTAAAAGDLTRRTGAALAGYSFLMTLSFLRGEDRLGGTRIHSLVRY
jgi:adenine phosphoribosyltransferase